MPATPLTDAIQALTTYANETTGASDTTLSAAVGTLVAGYGGGGLTQLYNSTLVQNTRSVTINFTADMKACDFLLIIVSGELETETHDWVYWNIDSTSFGQDYYTRETKVFTFPYMFAKNTNSDESFFVWFNKNNTITGVKIGSFLDWTTLNYLWFSGYGADFKSGTSFTVFGGKYSDF